MTIKKFVMVPASHIQFCPAQSTTIEGHADLKNPILTSLSTDDNKFDFDLESTTTQQQLSLAYKVVITDPSFEISEQITFYLCKDPEFFNDFYTIASGKRIQVINGAVVFDVDYHADVENRKVLFNLKSVDASQNAIPA